MNDQRHCSSTSWYVIRTHPRQEFRAEQNLAAGAIDVFLPKMRARRPHRCASAEATPLFPQYLFGRFDLEARLRHVMFTRGVQAPVRVGDQLATVDDAVVVFLRGRMDGDGLIRVGEPLRPGERVIIENGPFAALLGVVERVFPERERVLVLLAAIRAPVRVELAVDSVRRLPTSAA